MVSIQSNMGSHSSSLTHRLPLVPALMAVALATSVTQARSEPAPAPSTAEQTTPPAPDDTRPMTVTTDSPEFCGTLLRAIDNSGEQPLPADVSDLRQEGVGLCQHGKVRLGIVRLRRALVALRDERNER